MAGKDKRKEAKEGRVLPGSRPYVSDRTLKSPPPLGQS